MLVFKFQVSESHILEWVWKLDSISGSMCHLWFFVGSDRCLSSDESWHTPLSHWPELGYCVYALQEKVRNELFQKVNKKKVVSYGAEVVGRLPNTFWDSIRKRIFTHNLNNKNLHLVYGSHDSFGHNSHVV